MESISSRIKAGLELRHMKQVELVEKTNINKGALSSYISGKYEPKQKNIYLIAKALDVNEAWLMGYDVPMERLNTTDELSEDNINLLNKYNLLDEKGKHTVNTVLDMEFNRCSATPKFECLAAHADDETDKEKLKHNIDMIQGEDW